MQGNKINGIVWRVVTWMLITTLLVSGCTGKKKYKVGVLVGIGFTTPVAEGFKEGMQELGYVEGENITYDVQTVEFDIPTYQKVIKKFIADKVDLILVTPTEAT